MAIDFPSRVDSLADFLWAEYRISDRPAIEILVSSLLPIPGLPYPRIILETAWPAFDTSGAWFTLAGALPTWSLADIRSRRPRYSVDKIHACKEEESRPTLLVESNYERPARAHGREYAGLLQSCVRLRTMHPKSAANLLLSPARASAKVEKFKALVKDVTDCRFRAPLPVDPPALPADFLYWCELAFKLAGTPLTCPTWETLINHAAWVAIRRAYLYDRPVEPSDWTLSSRILADAIPWWALRVIDSVSDSETDYATAARVFKYTKALPAGDLRKALRRARVEGVLQLSAVSKKDQRYVWRVPDDKIYRLASGSAFHV